MTKQTWQKLIGIFEIVMGVFLTLPGFFVFTFYYYLQSNYVQIASMDNQLLTKFAVLQISLMVGLVIIVNGVWKIRSNRY